MFIISLFCCVRDTERKRECIYVCVCVCVWKTKEKKEKFCVGLNEMILCTHVITTNSPEFSLCVLFAVLTLSGPISWTVMTEWQLPQREAGDVWCLSSVWNLRAVIWCHFAISSLVLLHSPVTLSVLSFFLPASPFSWTFSRKFFSIFR